MANDKRFVVKNGLQTQNVAFVNSDHTITVELLGDDVLSFSGDVGQLFSIADTMEGTIFSVNDISGIPSIEVDDDGVIRFAQYSGRILIGTDSDDSATMVQIAGAIHVESDGRFRGTIYESDQSLASKYLQTVNLPNILDSTNVSSIIIDDVDKAFIDALNIDADTLDNQDGVYYLNYNNFTNTPNILDSGNVSDLVTYEALNTNGDVGTGATQVAQGNHSHSYNPTVGTDSDLITSGAWVVDDLTLTDGVIISASKRQISPADIGAATSGHTHQTYDHSAVLSGANVFDQVDVTDGIVTNISTRVLTLANLGYTGATDANNYTHPTHTGDDIDIDTTPLSGATVISDLDFNVTTDSSGHVTDANAFVATRNITAGDVGAATSGHTHGGVYEPVDATILREADVDDTPVNGVTTAPVSSNWAYDHANAADPHTQYLQSNQTITLSGDASGSGTTSISVTVANNSHDHLWANISDAPALIDSADVSLIITSDVDKAFVDALNVDADTLDNQDGTYYLNYNNLTNKPTIADSSTIAYLQGPTEDILIQIGPTREFTTLDSGFNEVQRYANAGPMLTTDSVNSLYGYYRILVDIDSGTYGFINTGSKYYFNSIENVVHIKGKGKAETKLDFYNIYSKDFNIYNCSQVKFYDIKLRGQLDVASTRIDLGDITGITSDIDLDSCGLLINDRSYLYSPATISVGRLKVANSSTAEFNYSLNTGFDSDFNPPLLVVDNSKLFVYDTITTTSNTSGGSEMTVDNNSFVSCEDLVVNGGKGTLDAFVVINNSTFLVRNSITDNSSFNSIIPTQYNKTQEDGSVFYDGTQIETIYDSSDVSPIVSYATLNSNGDVGTGATQVARGNHTHSISDVIGLDSALDSASGSGGGSYTHPNHSGDVTSVGDGAQTLTVSAITSKTALTSGLTGTDEVLVNDAGTLKRMDVSVFNTYFNNNLSFNPNTGTDSDINTAAANVIDTINVTGGVINSVTQRTLTLGNLGYTGETNATADQSDAEIETAYNNQVSIVTQPLAEAGVSTTVYRWTPQRVKQAIVAIANDSSGNRNIDGGYSSSVYTPAQNIDGGTSIG